MFQSGVIAAYSGGKLPGAIGIVRMSGAGVLDIMDHIFKPKRGKLMSECKSNEMIYGPQPLVRIGNPPYMVLG